MLLYLFLLFTIVPVVELYLLIQLGGLIGTLQTVGLVLLTGAVGAYLARSQGQQVLKRIEMNLQKGAMPSEELIHAFLIVFGGILLVTPGVLTDILGFAMIIPGTRFLFGLVIKQLFQRGVRMGNIRFHTFDGQGFPHHHQPWEKPQREKEKQMPREPADVIDINSYRSE